MPKVIYTPGKGLHQTSGTGIDLVNVSDTSSPGLNYRIPIVNLTSADNTITKSQSGALFTINSAGGAIIRLPESELGLHYDFYVGTDFTQLSSLVLSASALDSFQGAICHMTGAVQPEFAGHTGVVAMNENITTTAWNFPAAADDRMTVTGEAGTESPIFAGSQFSCIAVSGSLWMLDGMLITSASSPAHSFSAQ